MDTRTYGELGVSIHLMTKPQVITTGVDAGVATIVNDHVNTRAVIVQNDELMTSTGSPKGNDGSSSHATLTSFSTGLRTDGSVHSNLDGSNSNSNNENNNSSSATNHSHSQDGDDTALLPPLHDPSEDTSTTANSVTTNVSSSLLSSSSSPVSASISTSHSEKTSTTKGRTSKSPKSRKRKHSTTTTINSNNSNFNSHGNQSQNPEKSYSTVNIQRKIRSINAQLSKRSTEHALLCPQLSEAYAAYYRHTQDEEQIQGRIDTLKDQLAKIQAEIRTEEEELRIKKELITVSEREVNDLEMKIPCPWNENYTKLKHYRETHGNIDLPSRCAHDSDLDKLCIWLNKQKAQYKAYCEGSKTTTRPFRINALEQLGVRWTPRNDKWMINYDKLKKFKEEHGTTVVPTKAHRDKNFAHWVATQRYDYKLLKEGKRTHLTSERLGLLQEIGFVFNVFDQKWDEMFSALVEFRNLHGHVNVVEHGKRERGGSGRETINNTIAANMSLVKWVERQRMEYQLFVNGQSNCKKCRLTKERIKRLQDIGFLFVSDGTASASSTAAVTAMTCI